MAPALAKKPAATATFIKALVSKHYPAIPVSPVLKLLRFTQYMVFAKSPEPKPEARLFRV